MPRSRRLVSQINVVPFIDVMLVLLVIFMVAAPLINPGEIELPRVDQSLKPPVAPLEVIIAADGRLELRDRARSSETRPVSRPDLVETLKVRQAQNPEQPVVIAADRNVRYEKVLEVMDLLQRNQVKRVGLLARPAEG